VSTDVCTYVRAFERQRHGDTSTRERFEDRQFQAMRVRIIVLFTDEDDVGAGHVRRHHFEVRKRRTPGVVHALRNVRARNRLRLSPRRRGRQPGQRDQRAGHQYNLHVCCC
jgi:hypothetical protein